MWTREIASGFSMIFQLLKAKDDKTAREMLTMYFCSAYCACYRSTFNETPKYFDSEFFLFFFLFPAMLNILCKKADGTTEGINPVELETEKGRAAVANRCGYESYEIFRRVQNATETLPSLAPVKGSTTQESNEWGETVIALGNGTLKISELSVGAA